MAEKPSGYRLEYATSARAKCKGPAPCKGTTIQKGEFRVGTLVDFRGNTSFAYRHWGCTTPKIFENMKKSFEDPSELDGYDDLKPEDQAKVKESWQQGHVAEGDIPASAKKDDGAAEGEEEEEKPKKKAKKTAAKKADESEGESAAEKPKKARASKAKVGLNLPYPTSCAN
ncbi:poly polymerase and DNA-ligase Zn-finger region-domain-containing protein [Crucibulum laeve]|uniref:Poly polymerase and DNA-ligase Zn-finger region-domain-containing protein n=1 Tax=Crucibulum laeve TaxID=68775 RepID=A0A5C3M9V6_9AGAR|nr:poly polymerase and DNA-ligase Zn-finger region-domain-containing protein [Crucibulum laeve]